MRKLCAYISTLLSEICSIKCGFRTGFYVIVQSIFKDTALGVF